MKKKTGTEMPQTEQCKYEVPGVDASPTTALPPCTEYDLVFTPSRTRIGSWGDEQTFTVVSLGNQVSKKGNY